MRLKTNKFSVHYDRIVAYNFPEVRTALNEPESIANKGGKTFSKYTITAITILSALFVAGTIWLCTPQKSITNTSVRENIVLENIKKGQVMGRP